MTVPRRQRVAVYVEGEGGLLVFDHRDHPEAGTQIPAGGVRDGETLVDAARREVHEETGVWTLAEPVALGTHEHVDGLGRPATTHYFRIEAPPDHPASWEHLVEGDGDDAGLVFRCRFDLAPALSHEQAIFRPLGRGRAAAVRG
ncbi:MAG TPA: NUDIX domain-containing protein [Gaiellaceae bacterium]|nr:NUDIX domain-containing protein [Gaiellaceae bacterium]